MRDPRSALLGHAERVLELRAAGQHRPAGRLGQGNGRRDVAAGTAQNEPPSSRQHSHHRIIGPGFDRAVVHEQQVGDVAQPVASVAVLEGDRLV